MKVLITGITGFVGPYLANHLLENGHQVFGFGKEQKEIKKVNIYQINVLDKDEIFSIINEIKPDYIFHLAGFSSVKNSFEQPDLCKKINVIGTRNILDAVIKAKLNPRIVVVSSADIYGIPKIVPISETAELNPVSPYAESRKEQEKLCLNYCNQYKLSIIITRSFPHIGPGQSPIFVCSDFAKQIVEIEDGLKKPIVFVGNLSAKRDFIDVRDIVKAYLLAIEKCDSGQIYNLCSGKNHSINEILEKLLSFSKVKINIEHDSNRMRPSDIPILQGDYSKFKLKTGWEPKIPLEETLRDILEYWRKQK